MALRRLHLFAALAVALAAVAAAWILSGRSGVGPDALALRPDDRQVVERGAQVYRTHCAACHGAQLEGQANWRERGADGLLPAPPHDAGGHTWHHPDDVLFRITKHGLAKAVNISDYKTAMPVYEGTLSDGDIVAVLSWIKSRWPAEIRQRHDKINADHRKSRDRNAQP